jgi:aryl-alcohol dehydrogenase-like predicted oxidoreductase
VLAVCTGVVGDEQGRADAAQLELGVTFIDTADSYGPDVSEELIAEALYP